MTSLERAIKDSMSILNGLTDLEEPLQRAARLLEQACRLHPEEYLPPTLLALVYNEAGRTTEGESTGRRALELIRKHLELNPGDARAMSFGATRLASFGERSEALEWADRAVVIDPEEPTVIYNVACVYALQKQTDKAITCLSRTVAHGRWWKKKRFPSKFNVMHIPDFLIKNQFYYRKPSNPLKLLTFYCISIICSEK